MKHNKIPIYFILALMLAFSSCAKKEARVAAPVQMTKQATRTLGLIADRNERIKTLRALGRIAITQGEIDASDAAVVIAMPDKLRVDLSDSLADVIYSAGFDGKRMWISIPAERRRYEGRAGAASLKRATGLDCDPKELTHILVGAVPLSRGDDILQDGERYEINGKGISFWIDPKRGVPTRIVKSLDDKPGRIVYDATLSDYRKIGGEWFPHVINAESPKDRSRIELRYSSVELNKAVGDDVFKMPAKSKTAN